MRQSQIVQSVMQDYQYDLSHLLPVCNLPGGVLPHYMGYIGMCGPKEYGFSAVLVIKRASNLADSGHK